MFKKLVIFIVFLVGLAIAGLVGFSYYYNGLLEPIDPVAVDQYHLVDIPSGSSTEYIAGILYREGLIKNELAFRFYVRQNNLGQSFMAGRYNLSPSMSLEEIIDRIQRGEVYTETTWFTIPEGLTIEETARRLEETGLVGGDEFLSLAKEPSENIIEMFPFLQDIDNPDIDYILQGYLFPDTYEVFTDADEEDIMIIMLHRLDSIFNDELINRMNELGLSMHETLTLASIVEREAVVDHERALIAGVFHNRIRIGQRLESCATIQYILGETKEYLTFQDLEIPSPYNTYQNAGLPPGPIAGAGEASILATLFPETTDYFFFNYKYDGSGEHYFSRTLDEHNQNVARAEANLP
jgi:UPF0755 protein